jgi:prevent-host-death family protein
MATVWQLQEAKQRFSEVVRQAEDDGPQVVTRHGQEVVVVIAFDDYQRLVPGRPGFKEFLRAEPFFDDLDFQVDLDVDRSREPAPEIELEP